MENLFNEKAWDSFFNHGVNQEETIFSDIMTGLLQDKNTLFFNREFGCGISKVQNRSGVQKEVEIRFSISDFIARRNLEMPSRLQAITSNSAVFIEKEGGQMNITVNYYRPDLKEGIISI